MSTLDLCWLSTPPSHSVCHALPSVVLQFATSKTGGTVVNVHTPVDEESSEWSLFTIKTSSVDQQHRLELYLQCRRQALPYDTGA